MKYFFPGIGTEEIHSKALHRYAESYNQLLYIYLCIYYFHSGPSQWGTNVSVMTIRGRSVTSGRMSLSPTSVTSIDKTCYNTWHENLVSFGPQNFCMNDCELAKSKKHSSLLLRENVKNKRTVYFLELQHSVKISNIFW